MSETIHFEFWFDGGDGDVRPFHGALPREAFDALLRGECPGTVHISELRSWDPERQAFVAQRPGAGESSGEACFRSDRIVHVWPVAPPAAESVVEAPPEPQPAPRLRGALEAFFGDRLESPPILKERLAESELPNLELAVDDYLTRESAGHELIGVASNQHFEHHPSLRSALVSARGGPEAYFLPRVGSPEWRRLAIDPGVYRDCLAMGVRLVRTKRGPIALAVWPQAFSPGSVLEVMALTQDLARDVLDDLREGMTRLSVYRGKVIELRETEQGCGYEVAFAPMTIPGRDDIVLPKGLLEMVERNTLAALRHREPLLTAGRHLRRGVLLHGKPGTGKTLTARYLVGQLQDYTVIRLTGPSLGLLSQACRLGRALSPCAVILEDVDLIAQERVENRYASLLHDLLDEMDGLSPKIEMVFLLTTNRPDILEPALASRPGRIDQAIEFPLPDEAGRRRLFELFARGMNVAADLDAIVARTEGASGAFIEELLRRALIFAAEDGTSEIGDTHLDGALRELVHAGGELTRSLLGFRNGA